MVYNPEIDDGDTALTQESWQKTARNLVVGSLTTGLIIWGGIGLVGTEGQPIGQDSAAETIRRKAAKKYNSKALREKFELTFTRVFTVTTPSTKGGSGLKSASKPYAASFGQTCLNATPYDTKSETATPPAHFHIDDETGYALVTPYGSSSEDSLSFVIDNGELVPTTATIATLIANTCIMADGIPASKPHYSNGTARVNAQDLSAVVGPLHPRNYNQ